MREIRRIRQALFVTALVFITLCPSLTFAYSGGTGTPEDPYLIQTPEELNFVGLDFDNLDKCFKLAADLDMSAYAPYTDTEGNIINLYNQIYDFSGLFDGDGHVIHNLTYHAADFGGAGLFGSFSGTLKNLGLENVNIISAGYAGALVAYNNSGTILNCYSTGSISCTDYYAGGLAGANYLGTISDSYSNISISGISYVGGLVGDNSGSITRSYHRGTVNGTGDFIGGLTGVNYQASVTACYNTGAVNGSNSIGGLTGINDESTVENCYNLGAVDGSSYVGGLVGDNSGSITRSYHQGTVNGGNFIGGLTGINSHASVTACSNTGAVNGSNSIGGITGINDESTVENCYNLGAVDGINLIGGLIGDNNGPVAYCYSSGAVMGVSNVGGLIGNNNISCPVSSSFWDTQTSGQTISAGGMGKTTAQMRTLSTFISSGWDFTDETDNGTQDIWFCLGQSDYPHLTWENIVRQVVIVPNLTGLTLSEAVTALESLGLSNGTVNYLYDDIVSQNSVLSQSLQPGTGVFQGRTIDIVLSQGLCPYSGGGNGTQSNPCKIATREDLLILGTTARDYDKYFVLTDDIDLSPDLSGGQIFTNAVIAPITTPNGLRIFEGVIDGQGHKIKNITIHADDLYDNVGFISVMGSGRLSNICLQGINIESHNRSAAGCLAGEVYGGVIENCSVQGQIISQTPYVGDNFGGSFGGLIGYAEAESRIENCYSDVDIQGQSWEFVGGLIAVNEGTVNNCYATGWLSDSKYVGGLIGGKADNAIVNGCFWDTETSGQTTSDGGTALTTSQMQDINTYLSAGWDFVGETINGTSDIWQMPADQYPHFVWQGLPDTIVPEIVGITQAQGETAIAAANLQVGHITYEYNDTIPAEIIISQSPAANLSAYSGSRVALVVSVGKAYYNNGSGTLNEPYRVSSSLDLNTIGLRPDDWNKYFILAGDIDMSVISGSRYNVIGTAFTPFTGTFNGDGHVIRNFTGFRGGLFGQTSNAKIENLGLENMNVNSPLPGGMVDSLNGGVIRNCYCSGVVSGGYNTGGLVGRIQNNGLITNCHTSGNVDGYNEVGGLVGYLYSGTISNCYSTASVTGKNMVGGLVGSQDGGFIIACCSTGNVSGEYAIGGLVGEMSMYDENHEKTIRDCYARGNVSGKDDVGGLVGNAVIGKIIQNCYSTGQVTCQGQSKGGLIGFNSGYVDVINSFWDIETSGLDSSNGGRGRATAQMKTASNYIGWNRPANIVWLLDEGQDYPHLAWENTNQEPLPANGLGFYLPGSGTQANPYQIQDAEDLNIIGRFPSEWDKHFILTANIDMSSCTGIDYNIIGISEDIPFTGTLEGNGHVIRNLTYVTQRKDYYLGLFGALNGKVTNLGLENGLIQTTGSYVGLLAGYLLENGQLENCYTTGSIAATGNGQWDYSRGIGGLVGECDKGSISNCYSHCTVFGYDSAGGLLGSCEGGSITNCYSYGAVSGVGVVGGLVGVNNAYSGYMNSNFWDIETSGQTSSEGGTGKTTAEMKNPDTFITAGWDFANETMNGTKDIWRICTAGESYPKLRGQTDWLCPDGVGQEDLAVLTGCWLAENAQLHADITIDGAVNLADFIVLAQQWQITDCGLCGGADITGDGSVDQSDLTQMADQWLLSVNTGCRMADLNNDGKINLADYALFATHWLEGI